MWVEGESWEHKEWLFSLKGKGVTISAILRWYVGRRIVDTMVKTVFEKAGKVLTVTPAAQSKGVLL